MFFAAERELRSLKRKPVPDVLEGLTIDSEMEISVGNTPKSRVPTRKSLDSVYPVFSSTSMNDIIKIADPDYAPVEESRPAKKQRSNAPLPPPVGDLDLPEPILSPKSVAISPKPKKFDSLDDLINSFPELQQLIQRQEQRRRDQKVPLDYVRPYQKPREAIPEKPIPQALQPTVGSIFSSIPKEAESKPLSMATSTPEATSTPPTPAEPLPGLGGGLLAGIDDLFGDSKRTKLKSKSRR